MNPLRILLGFASACAMVIPVKRALHMFQQNRYEYYRYTKWCTGNIGLGLKKITPEKLLVPAALIAGLLIRNETVKLVVLAVLAFLTAFLLFSDEKKAVHIKPLVYTGRVKRQIAVMTVLCIALIWLFLYFRLDAYLLPAVYLLPWLLIYVMAVLTDPVETMVKKHYLNEAKSILKDHTGLIKIGITGSYGKTSTKNIVQAMLSQQYNSLMTPASYNTPMGITRTIREMLKPIHKVFVCEMGADHVGEITYLMDFVQPQIGIVTSIGPQHLNTFGSQENIIKEKMEIIEKLPADGLGIMNVDNDFVRNYKVRNNVRTVTYGIRSENADYRAVDIRYTPAGSRFTVVHGDEQIPIETKLLGELNVLNILSAICTARGLDVKWPVIQRAAKTMNQVEHRLEMKIINGYRFIDDAFNSNPAGSEGALNVLAMMPNRRFIVTPGMIDLGEKQDAYNREFGKKMKDKADEVILVGEIQTKPIYEGLQESGFDMEHVYVVKTVKEAFALVYAKASREDTILLENDLPDAFSH